MKGFINSRRKELCKSIILILILWSGLSYIYPPLILPNPLCTIRETFSVLSDEKFILNVLITLKRLGIGLLGAIIVGSILGICIGESNKMKNLFAPVFHIIQATPPISWLALGMIWFGLDGQATIFIVFIASVPIMIINIAEGFDNINGKLLEMATTFEFSRYDILINITLPSLKSYFKSGITIAVGLAWKLVIMGEVLSSNDGIGAQITNARLNIETAEVLAWTIIIIVLGVLSQKIIDILFKINCKGVGCNAIANEKCKKGICSNGCIKKSYSRNI